jgi:OFA family oxalate/formate antiporter-like MFS transporter
MMVISIYQYSWSLFAYNLRSEFGWDLAKIGLVFSIFAYTATFIQPFSGMIADSFGPRTVAVLGSFFVGSGFVLSSWALTAWHLFIFYGFGGIGVGILYGVSTASAIKWFPERRGFAVGLIVFGFGAGTAFFNWVIQDLLESIGLRTTFLYLGLGMLAILVPLSVFYRYPPDRVLLSPDDDGTMRSERSDYGPLEMLRSYQWYLIYFCFTFTVSIVLMFGAQMKMLAREFDIPQNYFSLLLIMFPLGNGMSRVVAGVISDTIGREKTMMCFYGLLGLSIICLVTFGHIPLLFVIIVFLSALLGGSPFALYPATIGDYYGAQYSTTNYGITYTAKAWAGLISGWLSAYLVTQFGSYKLPLLIVAVCSLIAALLSFPRWMKAPVRDSDIEGL